LQTGRKRPLGVTIVAILMLINGIILIASGAFGITTTEILAGEIGNALTGGIVAISSVVIALGIASLIIAWGLITGKGWAWIITVILSIISIIMSIISIVAGSFGSIVSLIINGVILYYMYRPDVKSYFGRRSISA
jgi:uncharacterized membrane protein (DUF2068 family)